MPAATTSAWTLANGITVARIGLVPLVVVALLIDTSGGWRLVAAALFTLAAGTDRLDGYLARRMDQVTDWGKFVDPVADKLLMGATLVTLSWLGDLPWWVTAVIVLREVGITVMRVAALRFVVIPASRGGKVKTFLQSVGIGLFVLPLDRMVPWATTLAWAVILAAVALTVITGVDYLRRGYAVRRASVVTPGTVA